MYFVRLGPPDSWGPSCAEALPTLLSAPQMLLGSLNVANCGHAAPRGAACPKFEGKSPLGDLDLDGRRESLSITWLR